MITTGGGYQPNQIGLGWLVRWQEPSQRWFLPRFFYPGALSYRHWAKTIWRKMDRGGACLCEAVVVSPCATYVAGGAPCLAARRVKTMINMVTFIRCHVNALPMCRAGSAMPVEMARCSTLIWKGANPTGCRHGRRRVHPRFGRNNSFEQEGTETTEVETEWARHFRVKRTASPNIDSSPGTVANNGMGPMLRFLLFHPHGSIRFGGNPFLC